MSDDPGILLTSRLVQLQSQLDAQGRRLSIVEELLRPTPVPTIKQRLTVRDGAFYDADGKLFRDVSVTVAGDFLNQPDAKLAEGLDRIAACGCKIVRAHHVAVNDSEPPSAYQPSMPEWRAGFLILDRLVRMCKERGMMVWISLHHRQRVTDQEAKDLGAYDVLFETKADGTSNRWPLMPGEISTTFLVMPTVEEYVTNYCVELATRYKNEPTVALMTIANEMARINGYWPEGDRKRTDASKKSYRDAWFAALDEYKAAFGIATDREMYKWQLARFEAWQCSRVYRRIYKRLRDAGVTCPIGSTNSLGDVRMNVVPILASCDFSDFHTYGYIGPTLPNPFEVGASRSIGTIARALRIKGLPQVCGEHANVWESKKQILPYYNDGPLIVANAGVDISAHYCAWLGPIGGTAGYEFNGFEQPGFSDALKLARDWYLSQPIPDRVYHPLTEEQLFGTRVRISQGVYEETLPPIVGTVDYGASGVELPASVIQWSK